MASHKRRPVRALVTAQLAACAALALAAGVSPYPDLALDLEGRHPADPDLTVTAGQREITDDDITQADSITRNRIDAWCPVRDLLDGQLNIMVSIPNSSQEQLDPISCLRR